MLKLFAQAFNFEEAFPDLRNIEIHQAVFCFLNSDHKTKEQEHLENSPHGTK